MDCHLAGKSVMARLLGIEPAAGSVAEVDVARVDRLHFQRMTGRQALIARAGMQRTPGAVGRTRVAGAQGGTQILPAHSMPRRRG